MSKTKILALVVAICGTALYFTSNFLQEEPWENHIGFGISSYQSGNYTEAENHFKAALKQANTFGTGDSRLHFTLNNLSEVYRVQSKYAEAEPIIKRVLEIDEKSLGVDHSNIAASLSNLADNYIAQEKYSQAEPLYKRALAIWDKRLGPNHFLVGHLLKKYAELLHKLGRNHEAEILETRIQKIQSAVE